MSKNKIKNKIISITESLFIENGYDDVRIREISALAEISIGSFYRYFESKEELFKLFHHKIREQIIDIITVEITNKNGIDKMKILFNTYVDFILKYGYKFISFFISLTLEKNSFMSPPKTLHTFLQCYIDEAVQNSELDDKYNSDYIFETLISTFEGSVFNWCISKGETDLKDNFMLTFNILINEFKSKVIFSEDQYKI